MSHSIKIESGIPIPENRGRKPKDLYVETMKKLGVGNSFVADGDVFQTLQSALRKASQKAGIKITTRRVPEDDPAYDPEKEVQLRVWRIEDSQG